jgi:hypothetical protein
MPKTAPDPSLLKVSLQRNIQLQERNKAVLNKMKTEGVDKAGIPVRDYQIKQFEDLVNGKEQAILLEKAQIENFTQKSLLDKNHQERYLQELVNYAGERGDVSKIRVPTTETASKVQGYEKYIPEEILLRYNKAKADGTLKKMLNNTPATDKILLDKILKGEITTPGYPASQITILNKYAEQPKTIKKLFGAEPKVVTDSKGNTWYEFDIPEAFKAKKGEIKAFSTGGIMVPSTPVIGKGSLQERKSGGMILELDDDEIKRYLEAGYNVEQF